MREVVLVAESVFRKAEKVFRDVRDWQVEPAPAAEEQLAEAVRSRAARAVIVGVERYVGPLYESLAATGAGHGAIIARFGVGHDGIDKPQSRRLGIVVANTPGVLDVSVAEHTLWLMGNLARKISFLDTRLRGGEFSGCTGIEVQGKSLAVLGFGTIGRRVAGMAHFGFDMRVFAVDCLPIDELERREGRNIQRIQQEYGVELYATDAEPVLQQADFLSIHLPLNVQTRHFINAASLAQMKPDAMLINTARGAIIDEGALYDALAAGRLGGAALDVFETEPYVPIRPDKDMRSLDNVILTPHIASNTHEANRRMAESCLANAAHFFSGQFDKLTLVDGQTSFGLHAPTLASKTLA